MPVVRLTLVPDLADLPATGTGPVGSGFRLVGWRERATRLRPSLGLAIVAAVAVLSGGVAAAATLGTSSGGLSAGSEVIASCGAGMEFTYIAAYYAGERSYALNGIDLTNIPAGCLNKRLSATFYDSRGNSLGSRIIDTLPASGTAQSVSIDPTSNYIDTTLVSGVSVVIA